MGVKNTLALVKACQCSFDVYYELCSDRSKTWASRRVRTAIES